MARDLVLYLGSLMLRSMCIAAIAGVCTLWIRSVAVRHAIWVAVLIAMLLMPVADAVLPVSWIPSQFKRIAVEKVQTIHLVSSVSVTQPTITLLSAPAPATKRATDWWSIAAVIYVFVGLALVTRLGLTLRKILRLKCASIPVASNLRDDVAVALGLKRLRPELRESNDLRVPITLGFLRPVVLLPSDWTQWEEWKLRAVLSHEFAHVRRADWAIAAIAAINQCMFWFNPLTAFLKKHLSELAERSSDDAALRLTADSTRYAEVLLQFAAAHDGYRFHTGGIAMAKHNMRSRIERVLNVQNPGNGILKFAGWALVLTLAMPVLYAAAAIQVASNAAPAPAVGAPQSVNELQKVEQLVHYLNQMKESVKAEQAGLQTNPERLAEIEKLMSAIERQNAAISNAVREELLSSPEAEAEKLKQTNRAIEETMRRLQEQAGLQANPEKLAELEKLLSAAKLQYATIANAARQDLLNSPEAAEKLQEMRQRIEETIIRVEGLWDRLSDVAAVQSNRDLSAPPASTAPKVVSRVEPVYPPVLQSSGIEGTVQLQVTIGTDGRVAEIKSMNSVNPLLLAAAIEAVRQWVFEPTKVNGQATTVTTEVPIDFKLNPAENGNSNRLRSDALLDLPDNQDDLLAYLTQLAQLRGGTGNGIAINLRPNSGAGVRPPDLVSEKFTTPFTFELQRSQNGQFSVHYSNADAMFACDRTANCKFELFSNGVASDGFHQSGFLGVSVTQTQDKKDSPFTLACRAPQCAIVSDDNGKTVTYRLKSGETASFPSSAKIFGSVK